MVSSEPEKMHYPSQCGINPSAMHKIQTFTDRQPLIDKDSWYTLSLEKGKMIHFYIEKVMPYYINTSGPLKWKIRKESRVFY